MTRSSRAQARSSSAAPVWKFASQKAARSAASPSSSGHQRAATCPTPRRMRSACPAPVPWRRSRRAAISSTTSAPMAPGGEAGGGEGEGGEGGGTLDQRLQGAGDQAVVDHQAVAVAVGLDLAVREGIELERLDDPAVDGFEGASADAAALC